MGVMTDIALYGGEWQQTFPDLKASSECLLVSLTEVPLRGGKALGSEEGKASGSELRYEKRKEFRQRI
jgi:hypothetical protein